MELELFGLSDSVNLNAQASTDPILEVDKLLSEPRLLVGESAMYYNDMFIERPYCIHLQTTCPADLVSNCGESNLKYVVTISGNDCSYARLYHNCKHIYLPSIERTIVETIIYAGYFDISATAYALYDYVSTQHGVFSKLYEVADYFQLPRDILEDEIYSARNYKGILQDNKISKEEYIKSIREKLPASLQR